MVVSFYSPNAYLPPPDLTWVRTEDRGWFRTISWTICTFIMLVLFIFNSIKWYQDLFTKDRKSLWSRSKSMMVSSRSGKTDTNSAGGSNPSSPTSSSSSSMMSLKKRKLPTLTPMYKFITTAVELALLCYFIATLVGFFSVWGWGCEWIFVFSLSCWELAKCFMYIVFIARLYTAYNDSHYRYNPIALLVFSIIVGCIAFALAIASAIEAKINPFVRYEHLEKTCGAIFPPELTSTISLFDFFMVFVCVFLFIYPLIMILVKASQDNDGTGSGSVASKRIIFLGLKYIIVSGVAAITSFIALLLITLHAGTTFAAWDMCINAICLMLMLPYYPNPLYYERICFPCHKGCHLCCIKWNKIYKLNMSDVNVYDLERVKSNDDDNMSSNNTVQSAQTVELNIGSDNNDNDNDNGNDDDGK